MASFSLKIKISYIGKEKQFIKFTYDFCIFN